MKFQLTSFLCEVLFYCDLRHAEHHSEYQLSSLVQEGAPVMPCEITFCEVFVHVWLRQTAVAGTVKLSEIKEM